MTRSALFDTIRDCYGDQYGLTMVRDVPEEDVLTRLGVDGSASYPRCTAREAVARLGFNTPAVRVGRSGEWTFLLDVSPHGRTFEPEVLCRLSAGTEVIVAWHLLDSTTKVAHARDGAVLGTYNDWTFERPEGTDPHRLDRALSAVGFFTEESEESDDFLGVEMVLAALEREFGMSLPPDAVSGSLPVVILPATGG